jgi:hypothetical protein
MNDGVFTHFRDAVITNGSLVANGCSSVSAPEPLSLSRVISPHAGVYSWLHSAIIRATSSSDISGRTIDPVRSR